MQAFSLDPNTGIPIKLQLKAHIRYQIMAGLMRPGDQLPPLRDLAAGLGINLNTVVRAIAELEEDGFVYSHQGRGVFVRDEFPGQGHGAALRSLLAGVLQPAREWGISPEELALAMMAHARLARPPQTPSHRLLLVAGSRPQLRRIQGEIEAAMPVVIDAVLPEEIQEKLRGADYKVAASTLFYASEVKALLPKGSVVTLATETHQSTFAALWDRTESGRLAIAARDWVQGARIRRSLEAGGVGLRSLEVVVGQTPAAFAAGLEGATAIITTPDAREMVRTGLTGRQAIGQVLPEPVELPTDALIQLRRSLGIDSSEPRLHVRSAWI